MSNQTSNKKSFRTKLSHFLGSYRGKTIFNFCYGFGASLAILGTMFKLLHLDGANIALAIGLGTEVFIFAISAFEPPFRNYRWEEVFPVLTSHKEEDRPEFGPMGVVSGTVNIVGNTTAQGESTHGMAPATVIIDKTTPQETQRTSSFVEPKITEEEAQLLSESIKNVGEASGQLTDVTKVTDVTERYLNQLSSMSDNLNRFSDATASLTTVSNVLLESYRSITENSADISENSKGYVEQMGYLNKNLYGLNTIYEIQLKSISSQIDTIDRINKGLVHVRDMYEGSMDGSERFRQETDSMAENLSQLNQLYARMLEAMKTNNNKL
jgi:gliding motility-associated protein GldL